MDAQPTCAIVSSLGDLGEGEPGDVFLTSGSINWISPLNDDMKPDYLSIGLFEGYGVFTDTLQPGTYELVGDELNYQSCGACITLLGDATENEMGVDTEIFYMATGGRLELTSVTGLLSGTLSEATFEHVEIDPMTLRSTPIGDGCVSSVDRVSFDVPL